MWVRDIPFWFAVLTLIDCAAPVRPKIASSADATASAGARLALEVLLLKPAGGLKSVGRGDFLQAGDHYNLRILSDRPAYLNVLLIGSSGQQTLLAPAASMPPVQPGTATVIPESDVLTIGPGGPERVFVIASPTPRNAAQVQSLVAQAHEASAEEVRDPPPISGPGNRPGEPTKLQLSSFGSDGSAALWFALTR